MPILNNKSNNPSGKKYIIIQIYISFNDLDAHDGLQINKDTVARNPSFLLYSLLHYTYSLQRMSGKYYTT